jgi:hypothetical protein
VVTAVLASRSRWEGDGSKGLKPKGAAKALRSIPRNERDATEVSEARSVAAAVGRQRPRSCPRAPDMARRARGTAEAWPATIRRSVHECRETLGTPVMPHGAQDSVGRPRDESRGASRERTRYGCTQIVQVAEVGRTHRASCPPEGRKALWRARALAGRKLEALPDAGHEWVEGETVREIALTIKSTRWFGLWVSARRFSIRRKVFSGFCPSCLHRQGEAGSFGSRVNLSPTIRKERKADSASVSTEAGRACPRVTKRTSEVDAIR